MQTFEIAHPKPPHLLIWWLLMTQNWSFCRMKMNGFEREWIGWPWLPMCAPLCQAGEMGQMAQMDQLCPLEIRKLDGVEIRKLTWST